MVESGSGSKMGIVPEWTPLGGKGFKRITIYKKVAVSSFAIFVFNDLISFLNSGGL
jgi:hypothetical protein